MSNPPVPTATTTSTPRSGHRGIAANMHKGHAAGFDGDLTQCERAWLRKLEGQYVTAADGRARAIVVAESLFVAPTLRCTRLAEWLQHVEGEPELVAIRPEEPGGPSTARLLARPGPVAPTTHPPPPASGESQPRLAGRKKVGKRRKR